MNMKENDDQDLPESIRPLDDLLKSIYSPRPATPPGSQGQSRRMAMREGSSELREELLDHSPSKLPGQRFGPYEIRQFLKRGSFGEVYRATHVENGQEVALKLPLADLPLSATAYGRFKREPRFLRKLDHPSIVALVDYGLIDQTFYLAMNYEPGCDLADWLAGQKTGIPESLVVEWGLELVGALQHAHEKGVVHRDLKPGNIIMVEIQSEQGLGAEKATYYHPKITDFGLAFSSYEKMSGSTPSDAVLGTLGYMPPEQVMPDAPSGKGRGDIRGDIYSLGIILAELVLGRPIRKPETILEYILNYNRYEEAVSLKPIRGLVKPDFYAILNKCVETDPRHRYQCPQELADDLERFRQGIPIVLRRPSSRENFRRIVRRNPLISISFVLTFIFMTMMIAGLLVHQYQLGQSQALILQTSYNANVRNGYTELKEGRVEAAHDILDNTSRMEQDSKKTLLEFGWYYLKDQACQNYISHQIKDFDLYLPGRDSARLGQLLRAYQTHTEENNFNFVSPRYYKTGLRSLDKGNINWLDEKHGMSLIWRTRNGEWYYSDGKNNEILSGPGRFDEIYCNPAADRFYYIASRDSDDGKSNRSIEIKTIGSRNNIFLNGFTVPAISLDGHVVTGLCRLQPSSGKLAWVVYQATTGQLMETGLEILDLPEAVLRDYRTEASQSGRFVSLYLNNRTGLHVFDTARKKMIRLPLKLDAQSPHDRTVGIDETRDLLITGDFDGNIDLFKFGTDLPLATFPRQVKGQSHVGFLPDGRCYFNQKLSDRIWIWDPFGPRHERIKLDHTDEVWSLAFDKSGHFLVSTGDDHHARLWDLKTRQARIIGSGDSMITCGRFSDDQSLFAACDYSGNLMIWETDRWNLIRKIQVSDKSLRSLAWGPGRDFLICVGKSDDIVEYHLKDASIRKHHIGAGTYDVVYSRGNDEFVIGLQDSVQKKLLFMKFPGGSMQGGLNPSRSPTRFAIDPAGNRLFVGFDEGGFGVVSLKHRTLDEMVDIGQSSSAVLDLQCTPDNRNVITTLLDKRTLIYETVKWEKVGEMNEHDAPIHAITISPDGKKLATGDMSGKIRVMEIPSESSAR